MKARRIARRLRRPTPIHKKKKKQRQRPRAIFRDENPPLRFSVRKWTEFYLRKSVLGDTYGTKGVRPETWCKCTECSDEVFFFNKTNVCTRDEARERGLVCTDCGKGIDWHPKDMSGSDFVPPIDCYCQHCVSGFNSKFLMSVSFTYYDLMINKELFESFADMPCVGCNSSVRDIMLSKS